MSNPYTPVFRHPPLEMVERKNQAERTISEFCQEHPSNCLKLVTGIRGCGKTVFITQIANRLGEEQDSNQMLSKIFKEGEINLQAFGFGAGIKGVPPVTDIEEALTRMLRSIQNHKKRVLITIDDATNSKDIRIFVSAFQIFLREELPVFLLMTGLYNHIDRLRNAKGMTFLERGREHIFLR